MQAPSKKRCWLLLKSGTIWWTQQVRPARGKLPLLPHLGAANLSSTHCLYTEVSQYHHKQGLLLVNIFLYCYRNKEKLC